jgi:hypothetical protein
LVQFDIAGTLPTSLQGNKRFPLIIENYAQKNWVNPLKEKEMHKGNSKFGRPLWNIKPTRKSKLLGPTMHQNFYSKLRNGELHRAWDYSSQQLLPHTRTHRLSKTSKLLKLI